MKLIMRLRLCIKYTCRLTIILFLILLVFLKKAILQFGSTVWKNTSYGKKVSASKKTFNVFLIYHQTLKPWPNGNISRYKYSQVELVYSLSDLR